MKYAPPDDHGPERGLSGPFAMKSPPQNSAPAYTDVLDALLHEIESTTTASERTASGTDTVSVVMPVYNGATYLRTALDSVFRQTVRPHEIIVVDDGSTDDTPDILAQYGAAITVLRQPNAGNAAARNTGAAVATGRWMAVLDADDEWEATKLEQQLQVCQDVDLVHTRVVHVHDDSSVHDPAEQDSAVCEGNVLRELLADNFIVHSSVLVRLESVRQVGGYDESLLSCCDWDLWIRMAFRGLRVRRCALPLTRYRWRAGSVSKDYRQTSVDRIRIQRRAFSRLPKTWENLRYLRRCLAQSWMTSAWFAAPTSRRQAARCCCRALWQTPFSLRVWREFLRQAVFGFRSRILFLL